MTRRLSQGNEATFLGAVKAGLNYYAGYPISPSSEILKLASDYAAKNPAFKFMQCEDEIASVNSIIGASLAGAKSMTATSGPGFSLMQEGIGYGHQVEAPAVIVNVQRIGPGTGMPTMPGQADIMQVKFGSSGDYFPLAFYPNSIAESYKYGYISVLAAEEAHAPVVFLSDAWLGHLTEPADFETIELPPLVERDILPLGKGRRFINGLTHNTEGLPRTSDAEMYVSDLERKRQRHTAAGRKYAAWEYKENPNADVLLIAYGITSRVIAPLAERFSIFRPISIWPVLEDQLRDVTAKYRQIVAIEANDGQYANLVELATRREVSRVPLQGGRITLERAQAGLDAVLKGSYSATTTGS